MASEAREKKLLLLLSRLSVGAELSVKEIMTLCDINRASVYNYINELNKRGYAINKRIESSEAIYSLSDSADNTAYAALTKKDFHKYLIMQQLSINDSLTRPELYSLFCENDDEYSDEPKYLGLGRTRFYKMIKELIETEDIQENRLGELTLTGKHYPVSLYFSDADELNSLCEQLMGIPQSDPFYPQLHSVLDKALFILGDENPPIDNESYLFYGCKYTESGRVQDFFDKISKFPYRSKALKITHNTKNGERTVILAIGMFIYSIEKDQLYIMGHMYTPAKNTYDEKFVYTLFPSSIINIKKTDYDNPYFMSEEFTDIYKTMFSVSTDQAEDVTVEFDRIYQIENKIKHLSNNRPLSKISYSEDGSKIIYTDTLRGLSDFAVYLRRFGRACHVIAPESLKNSVLDTRRKMLENYEALAIDEK